MGRRKSSEILRDSSKSVVCVFASGNLGPNRSYYAKVTQDTGLQEIPSYADVIAICQVTNEQVGQIFELARTSNGKGEEDVRSALKKIIKS